MKKYIFCRNTFIACLYFGKTFYFLELLLFHIFLEDSFYIHLLVPSNFTPIFCTFLQSKMPESTWIPAFYLKTKFCNFPKSIKQLLPIIFRAILVKRARRASSYKIKGFGLGLQNTLHPDSSSKNLSCGGIHGNFFSCLQELTFFFQAYNRSDS